MGRIIKLHDESHWALQSLLPWYVTGTLTADERAKVEAHLSACAECQEEVRLEQALRAEVAALPIEAGAGWARMQQRLAREPQRRRERMTAAAWSGWAAAAVLLLGVGVLGAPYLQGSGRYHALGSAPEAHPGNMVVIFSPDTTEKAMRAALTAAGARVVDGPTGADAYVLATPAAKRAGALALLRARADVVLAEPVDAPGAAP